MLKNVGPARDLRFGFAPRLNVLTGDNGLGKSFVLDVVWWVLTTTWAGEKAFPYRPRPGEAADRNAGHGPETGYGQPVLIDAECGIRATLATREGVGGPGFDVVTAGAWKPATQDWARTPWQAEHHSPGFSPSTKDHDEAAFRPKTLVVYARVDGSYAIFDSLQAGERIANFADAAVSLSRREVWDGKHVADPELQGGQRTVIGGLIADWVKWQQRGRSDEFDALRRVLAALSPPDEPMLPGEPTRVHLRDRRDIPTVVTAAGEVPVTLASAGMSRALSLAYLMVWAWSEHQQAARLRGTTTTRDVVLLIDEPELHQHPGWQRTFLPAVLKAVSGIAANAGVQVITATHSPLVLASLETAWEEELDDLFVFSADGKFIKSKELKFIKEGGVNSWLASEVFGGVSGRSRESEMAIHAAQHYLAGRLYASATTCLRLLSRLPGVNGDALADLSAVAQEMKAYPAERLAAVTAEIAWPKFRRLVERLGAAIHHSLSLTVPAHDEFWVHWILVYRPDRFPIEGFDAKR